MASTFSALIIDDSGEARIILTRCVDGQLNES